MDRISATIITKNAADTIERCLCSLVGIADEIIIVDSYSTDSTLDICRRYGCKITQREFSGFGSQRQYAVGLATYNYILSIDADKVLTEEARQSIMEVKANGFPSKIYSLRVVSYFCGKAMKHSGWAPTQEVRFFNRRYAHWDLLDIDEGVTYPDSRIAHPLAGEIQHYRCASVEEFDHKEQRRAAIMARVIAARNRRPFSPTLLACWHYLHCHIRQGAWLDGKPGNIIALRRFSTIRKAYTKARNESKAI